MERTIPVILAGALALSACSGLSADTDAATEPLAFPSAAASSATPSAETSVEQVVQKVLPSVVNVVTDRGEGTGFIVREDGIVVTNAHVVEGASSVSVLTSEDEPTEYDARVIGGDVDADLAILDVDADGLPTVPLGSSEDLQLGQEVVAIGYALGLQGGPSVTSGIVSSLTRRITVPDPGCTTCEPPGRRTYGSVIQTDAAINPGNSGGPLVDLAGNVVGINSAGTTSAENVGFAIQIDAAKPVIFQAAEDPDAPVAFMGISSVDADNQEFQFSFNPGTSEGAGIVEVIEDGPAASAGVRVGDVIVAFAGDEIADSVALGAAIHARSPGEVVEVVVVRSGERVTLTVTLGENVAALG